MPLSGVAGQTLLDSLFLASSDECLMPQICHVTLTDPLVKKSVAGCRFKTDTQRRKCFSATPARESTKAPLSGSCCRRRRCCYSTAAVAQLRLHLHRKCYCTGKSRRSSSSLLAFCC